MKNLGKIFGRAILLFLFAAVSISALAQKTWSEVKFNRNSVYLGEPVQVSVAVYTSTWFTEGVDPGNIQVNGAFTVYFRSVNVYTFLDGKTFPGVEMIFNVFPFNEEDIVFPSLDIYVETPKEGGYKGISRVIKTKERTIKVKPIPPGFKSDEWLVTSSLSVNQHWSGNLKNVKVGDVLERRITRSASNTVSELIPPIIWDSTAGVSFYPARSSVENHKSKTNISATRSETMRYLFEKEGEITLPEMKFTWWNPAQQKLYKRTLAATTIEVKANPDLGMLASIRDSLQAQIAIVEKAEKEADQPFTIFGLAPKVFAAYLAILVLLCFAIFFLLKWAIRSRKEYLEKYHNSELFYWRKFTKEARRGEKSALLNSLYLWIDHLDLQEPTAQYFAQEFGDKTLQKHVAELEKDIAKNGSLTVEWRFWRAARERYAKNCMGKPEFNKWINP